MADSAVVRTVDDLEIPATGTYQVDPVHSVLEFVVRHMGLAKVRGRFNEFEATIEIGENPAESSARAAVQAASVDTRDETRDTHLRSPDFLDAEQYPTIEFRSTGVRREGAIWVVDGDLTIRGITRSVALDVEFEGGTKDPWGNDRIGFSAATEVDREDFGLTWNAALETGGLIVGKRVKLELGVEAVRQAS